MTAIHSNPHNQESGQEALSITPYPLQRGQASIPDLCPQVEETTETHSEEAMDPGYLVICWDDPVNLMDYVTHVFQKVFGWNRQKAEHHMLEVHRLGKSVLRRDNLERAEYYVHQLHHYRLHATLEAAQ